VTDVADVQLGRRTLVTAGAAGLLFSSSLPDPALGAATQKKTTQKTTKRAYVLVVDGCRPDEIRSGLTPNLHRLRENGLNFPEAASLWVMETIPNHVMMMAGVRPDRTGVPANTVFDRGLGATRTMDRKRDIRTGTVIGRLNSAGFTTGTVLSKEYLYGVFGDRATHRWEPSPIIPVSGHAPDQFTMDAALAMVDDFDPHLVFVNLGDTDRFGHADFTGNDVQLQRQLALADTDRQVQRFVDLLKSSGRWKHSVVIVLADHSMDWSRPGDEISLQGPMDADPMLSGKVAIADNGGADLLYWTGAADQRADAIQRMREIAAATPGVLAAHDRTKTWLRLGPEAGDVVVFCKEGWRFSEPDPTGNPIPGNHGHPATRAIPFFITGGHPSVPRRRASSAHARTIDVAPTVAKFFGVGGPVGGYDGRNRL
jgi:hypothetical protein